MDANNATNWPHKQKSVRTDLTRSFAIYANAVMHAVMPNYIKCLLRCSILTQGLFLPQGEYCMRTFSLSQRRIAILSSNAR